MKKIILFSLVAITFPLFCCSGGTVNKSGEDDPWKWNDKNNPETTDDTEYYPKAATSFRIVSYNVGAFSKFMSNSTSMIADMLTEVKADVVKACFSEDSVSVNGGLGIVAAPHPFKVAVLERLHTHTHPVNSHFPQRSGIIFRDVVRIDFHRKLYFLRDCEGFPYRGDCFFQ